MKRLGISVTILALIAFMCLVGCQMNHNSTNTADLGTIRGTIQNTGAPAGDDLAGIKVTLQGRPDLYGITDANGNYQIENVPAGQWTVLVEGDDNGRGATRGGVVVPGGGTVNLPDIEILPTGSLSGTVTLADGGDVESAVVYIPGSPWSAKPDANGAYKISDVPEGTFDLVAIAPGYARAIQRGLAVTADQDTAVPAFNLVRSDDNHPGSAKLNGTVTVADGKMVPMFNMESREGDTVANPDAGTPIAGAEVTLMARMYLSPDDPVTGIKDPAGSDDAINRAPTPNELLCMGVVYNATTDEQGKWVIEGIIPDDYDLMVSAPEYLPGYQAVSLADNDNLTVDLSLIYIGLPPEPPIDQPCTLYGMVVDQQDAPVAGLEVAIYRMSDETRPVPPEPVDPNNPSEDSSNPGEIPGQIGSGDVSDTDRVLVTTVVTDAEGNFVVEGLMPGAYEAVAQKDGLEARAWVFLGSDVVCKVMLRLGDNNLVPIDPIDPIEPIDPPQPIDPENPGVPINR